MLANAGASQQWLEDGPIHNEETPGPGSDAFETATRGAIEINRR